MLAHGCSSKERLEASDQVVDQVNRLSAQFADWFTVRDPKFAERYLKGELHILVHFGFGSVEVQYVADFQRAHSVGGVDDHLEKRNLNVLESGESPHVLLGHGSQGRSDVHGVKGRPDDAKFAVLVDTVQLMEPPYGIVPSLVRLDRVDDIKGQWGDLVYYGLLSGLFVRIQGLADRERTPFELDRVAGRVNVGQVPDKVVKGAPGVVDSVAGQQGNVLIDGGDLRHYILGLSRLRISLDATRVRLGFKERIDDSFKLYDVLLGPSDFVPDKG
ncbi:MAG: hypothetical protein JST30_07430 [Armatimonadetes bacterium]|nr:hypothetical protein [Armatimonadota bacterium]